VDKNDAPLLYLLRDRSKMVDIPMKLISTCLRFNRRQNLLASAQIGFLLRPHAWVMHLYFRVLTALIVRTTLKPRHMKL